MVNRTAVIFCSVSLLLAIAVCAVGFSLAALPRQAVLASSTPTPPEQMPEIDLGAFGKVAVLDLMAYYIDNPPAPANAGGGAPAATKRFGGC